MNRIKLIILIVLLLLAAAACSAAPEPPAPAGGLPTVAETGPTRPAGELPKTEADVPRIPLEEARAAIENGAAIMVDVRAPAAYEKSHIAGAISVPLGEIERNLPDVSLNRDQWIITYCT